MQDNFWTVWDKVTGPKPILYWMNNLLNQYLYGFIPARISELLKLKIKKLRFSIFGFFWKTISNSHCNEKFEKSSLLVDEITPPECTCQISPKLIRSVIPKRYICNVDWSKNCLYYGNISIIQIINENPNFLINEDRNGIPTATKKYYQDAKHQTEKCTKSYIENRFFFRKTGFYTEIS